MVFGMGALGWKNNNIFGNVISFIAVPVVDYFFW